MAGGKILSVIRASRSRCRARTSWNERPGFLGNSSVSKGAIAANVQAPPFRNTSDVDYGDWLATQKSAFSERGLWKSSRLLSLVDRRGNARFQSSQRKHSIMAHGRFLVLYGVV